MGDMTNIVLQNSEWPIMECLWEKNPRTLMQLVSCLKDRRGWAKSTVATLVGRMEAKGLIYFKEGGRAKQYYPAVTREEVAAAETRSLLSRVYQDNVGLMMSTLVEQGLTRQEIGELYEILKKAEEAER